MATSLNAALVLRIRVIGEEAIKGIGREAEKIGKKAGAMQKALQFSAVANQAAEGFGRVKDGITQALQAPIDKFSEFELALAQARGKMDEISDRDFARMKKAAMDAGASSAFSATQAADGLGEMAAAGFTVNQQIAALPNVVALATAGQVELGRATAITANTMAQFGLKAEDTAEIGDLLTAASNASTIGLDEIAESLKYVGPIAKASGLSLKSTASFVAMLGNAGIESSSAGTALRGMLGAMAAPSGRAKKALAEVGLSTKDLAAGVEDPVKLLGLLGQQFQSKGLNQAERLSVIMRVFGRETSAAVASLIDAGQAAGGDGQTGFQKMAATMDKSGGSMKRFTDQVGNTSAMRMKAFKAQVDSLQIALGERLVPALTELIKGVQPMLLKFGDWVAQNPRTVAALGKTAIAIGAVAAALQVGALALGTFGPAWRVLSIAFSVGTAPLKLLGVLATSLSGALTSLAGAAAGAGATTSAMLLKFGALATQGLALAAAFTAGYQAGKLLDSMLGQLMGARGGRLSTEAALQMGESDGFNNAMLAVGNVPGFGWLGDAARGNMERNRQERLAAATGGRTNNVASTTPAVTPAEGQFNAVTGTVQIELTDSRPKVKVQTKGPVNLRVGQSPAGAR